MRVKPTTCRCKAYPFPHRLAGGNCTWETRDKFYRHYQPDSRDQRNYDAFESNQHPQEDTNCLPQSN